MTTDDVVQLTDEQCRAKYQGQIAQAVAWHDHQVTAHAEYHETIRNLTARCGPLPTTVEDQIALNVGALDINHELDDSSLAVGYLTSIGVPPADVFTVCRIVLAHIHDGRV